MKIGIISLGCDKNRVDTEYILAMLKAGGYEIESDIERCDIMIVNTCAFIERARVEAIDTILETAEFKKKNLKKLIVTGCLPQKYSAEIFEELYEVDAFVGINAYGQICKILEKVLNGQRLVVLDNESQVCVKNFERVLTTPNHYAYLKIADGCNNACSYCTIPSIRGKYRSRPLGELKKECEFLNNQNIKEIILVAQDVTRYGIDLYDEYKIVGLIREISKFQNIKKIRLMYCYPELVTDELIDEIKNNDKVCKYIDIPFQHVSDKILKAMRRRSTYKSTIDLIEKLRNQIKDISIRSTFITGFPGETDNDFNLLYNFIKTYKLENVGFFTYSKEEGTLSAKLQGAVPEPIKEARYDKLFKLQSEIIFEKNKEKVGKTLQVVCDGIDFEKKMFFGRSMYEAPDIDTIIYLEGKCEINQGELYNVKVIGYDGFDLYASIIETI